MEVGKAIPFYGKTLTFKATRGRGKLYRLGYLMSETAEQNGALNLFFSK